MIDRQSSLEQLAVAVRRSPVTALLGPRQCGKTTLARVFGAGRQAIHFDLESQPDQRRLQNVRGTLSEPSAAMSLEQEFDTRLAAIHGLDTLHTGSHNPGGNALDVRHAEDIRHAEFRAMTDIFLGENFDRRKVEQVESVQMALHEQQAVLYQRYEAEELGPEEYVEAFNTLLDETFVKCEDILGQEDFRKLFGAPRSELAGFIDKEAFLHLLQPP